MQIEFKLLAILAQKFGREELSILNFKVIDRTVGSKNFLFLISFKKI